MNERRYYIIGVVVILPLIYIVKLFGLQVIDDTYRQEAEKNIIDREVKYPYRGLIYDRNGELLVYNEPVYDLEVIPREASINDTARFCAIFGITRNELKNKLEQAKNYSPVKPSVVIEKISNKRFAGIQDQLNNFPGFRVKARTQRAYPHSSLANALGYTGEISKAQLVKDTTNYYSQGDFIGISGIEAKYEPSLRGKLGVEYKLVNVMGVEQGSFKNGLYDTTSRPGIDLISSIDLELQKYGERLMNGKTGSIVAIEPETGEILAMVSAPSYDPNLLTGKDFGKNYTRLSADTSKPLFVRPTMAMYPPGSMFKTVQSLIALQEDVIGPDDRIYCSGSLIGDHAPPGYYNITKGIRLSSNNFFYKVFRRIINQNESSNTYVDSRLGLEKWYEYIKAFGMGHKLSVDIPSEKSGYVPTPAYYDRIYGENRWKFSTIYSLSIGQGELLVTPVQMANLAATIANKGYFYTPHLVKGIGEDNITPAAFSEKNYTGVDSVHFNVVQDAMEEVVLYGTGQYRAKLKDISVCGKTSTVENPHGEDHSGFMAFAPKENPKIAIAVYVENAGQGARAAASIASLMIEKYIKGGTDRPWIEEYALKGDFIY